MGDKGGVCGLRVSNEGGGGGLGSELRGDEEMRVHGGGDKLFSSFFLSPLSPIPFFLPCFFLSVLFSFFSLQARSVTSMLSVGDGDRGYGGGW